MKEKMGENSGAPLVASFGEMLIDFIPGIASVSLAESAGFVEAPSGAQADVAGEIAKLGGRSALLGMVGKDEFGHIYAYVNILKQNRVETSGVLFDRQTPTALAFVTLRDDGEREFMFYRNPRAGMLLTEKEIYMDLILRSDLFHYGSISLISEPFRSAHLAALRAAKAAAVLSKYGTDPNIRLPLWGSKQ
ncbi:LOW QUALITY PROTEIN: fructokinase-2-like [Dendrobium catenatum]|uniref:LOW QUALITY PROTEIN: fructokinase-2-like n=1 Tax=Dendrobium catenatum TaxID=906689 RepID=UPI0009F4943C|nr:LOW QUALITY PROTEIN: fructokinase-2-like [Dendrobium catenatum]